MGPDHDRGVAIAIAASFALIKVFGWKFGSQDAASFEALPLLLFALFHYRQAGRELRSHC